MHNYIPVHFSTHEVVAPDDHRSLTARGGSRLVWWLFDPRILRTFDLLRDLFGPIVINDWFWRDGAGSTQRGWRSPEARVGAEFSQHRFGRALDGKPVNITAAEIRADMRANPQREAYQHITCVEDGVDWLHVDVRNWDRAGNGILFVKP